MERLEAIVIGAGHAGLAASQRLAAAGIDHLVLERDRIGESWRSQRWDTFALNTPSWANRLPGNTDDDVAPPWDAFHAASVFVDQLAAYAARWGLPVREGAAVSAVEPDGSGGFEVERAGNADPLASMEDDPADEPHPDPDSVHSPERLDLGALGIRTVIWATGVRGDFAWLPPRLVDADGTPIHDAGSMPLPGLFVLGLPWLTRRSSGIINGIGADAQRIADGVAARAA